MGFGCKTLSLDSRFPSLAPWNASRAVTRIPCRGRQALLLFGAVLILGNAAVYAQRGARPNTDIPRPDITIFDNSRPTASFDNSPLKFGSQAHYVLVPVVVLDSQKRPIAGLKKEDFSLFENGKPQAISSIDEYHPDATPVTKLTPPGSMYTNLVEAPVNQQKRLTVIALDLLNTSFSDQIRARNSILQYLRDHIGNDSLYQLVVINNKGMRIVHDFTQDPQRLINVLKNTPAETPDPTIAAAQSVDPSRGQSQPQVLTENGGETLEYSMTDIFRILELDDNRYQRDRAAADTLAALQHIAQSLKAVPGRKSLVWITASFPFNWEEPESIDAGQSVGYYQRTIQLLEEANVAVYPVDARGLEPLGLPGSQLGHVRNVGVFMSRQFAAQTSSIQTMEQIAEMTGGKAFYNRNDIDRSIQEATQDSQIYYVLSYKLDTANRKPGWRKLSVKLDRPEVTVRARKGFFLTQSSVDPLRSRDIDIYNALQSPLNYTSLPLHARISEMKGDGSKRKISFEIYLGANSATIDTENGNQMNLEFGADVRNEKGQTKGHILQTVSTKLKPEGVKQLQDNGITYRNTVEVPLGDYQIHFMVRDNQSGRIGTIVAPLKVM
jgi:VWFA-related protein